MPEISEIELTQQEIDAVIKAAKSAKLTAMYTADYNRRLNEEPVYPVYTTEQFAALKLEQATKMIQLDYPDRVFSLDQWNEKIFYLLCQYFNNDSACEKEGISLHKGIMLYGNLGCGKTFLMRLFEVNPKQVFRTFHCKEGVERRYKESGEEGIEPMYRLLNNLNYYQEFGQKYAGVCFDDLGTEEPEVNYYGNKMNLMRTIIESRYAALVKNVTHYTTNLTPDNIGERYGMRVKDRMRETINLIKFDVNAPSRRK